MHRKLATRGRNSVISAIPLLTGALATSKNSTMQIEADLKIGSRVLNPEIPLRSSVCSYENI